MSVVRAASPGRSLRLSYQVSPTVPRPSTAIAGWNVNAVATGTGVGPLQVRPPSLDSATSIVPEVAELFRSQATYTVPSGAIAAEWKVRSWLGSASPVSGSKKGATDWETTSTGADQLRPWSRERSVNSCWNAASPWISRRAKSASSDPFGSTRISADWSTAPAGAESSVTGADQLAPPSV